MRWRVHLRLGRVSNLPTVWTNALAGAVLAGASLEPSRVLALCFAVSLFYVGGMYLNDAFDREVDARERPERPIPSGLISAPWVFGIGFGLLAAGMLVVTGLSARPGAGGVRLVVVGALLCGAIVTYDAWHKRNPLGPLLMGACRMLVYLLAALTVSEALSGAVMLGALALLSYLIGLTWVAKHEARLRLGPRVVATLIAGISLLDAGLMAALGALALAPAGVAGFALTLALQRLVRGT